MMMIKERGGETDRKNEAKRKNRENQTGTQRCYSQKMKT